MIRYISFLFLVILFSSCKENNTSQKNPTINTIDSTHFITHSYIELDKISQISKFRSGIGHDYWDDFEHCRSMKHYFQPYDSLDWSKIIITTPVTGKIVKVVDEGRGMQIQIQPSNANNYTVIIFHVILKNSLNVGDIVNSGQELGTHYSNETFSDIAISTNDSNRYKLVSYFDVLPDSLFSKFIARGANVRSDFVISKELRDSDPLNCHGDTFSTDGTIPNWFYLK